MKKIYVTCLLLVFFISCKKDVKTETSDLENEPIEVVDSLSDSIIIDSIPEEPKQSLQELKEELAAKGFKTFDYVDEKSKDTILMQQYFMAFLKTGPIHSQNEEEAALLQEEHLAYLTKMYELGYADISGPFGDNGNIRGITIYNVPTLKMADSLANADPMVKAGRLEIEIHPWWAAKGFSLR